uniref:Uncharacterized protein n=1 Tax=Xiphophorus maculatus TaxID=8083 RepID=A0A3B5QSG7_XIPMA
MLQQDFVDLKTAHLLSQEAFSSEIQAEKEKGKALQEELDKLQTSYEELCCKYEADEKSLQDELEQVKRSYEELGGKYDRDVSGLKAQVETYKKEIDHEREARRLASFYISCRLVAVM